MTREHDYVDKYTCEVESNGKQFTLVKLESTIAVHIKSDLNHAKHVQPDIGEIQSAIEELDGEEIPGLDKHLGKYRVL